MLGAVWLAPRSLGQPVKQPVDYVNPYIGSIAPLLKTTDPMVQLPHGMMAVAPATDAKVRDKYLATRIQGFPLAGFLLMATTGQVRTDPSKFASLFDHDHEIATPYYHAVTLETYDIEADCTVARHAAHYRFQFPAGTRGHLLIASRNPGAVEVAGPATVTGHDEFGGTRFYFHAEFSKPFAAFSTWNEAGVSPGVKRQDGARIGFAADYRTGNGARIEVRVGISYISVEQARANLRSEIGDWDFDRTRAAARDEWNRALGRIQVSGGTEQQRTIFYTALYRTMLRIIDISEQDRYYSIADHQVHPAQGRGFYAGGRLWGSYRSLHPLLLLIDPARERDFIHSYVRLYEQGGWLPSIATLGPDRPTMYRPSMQGHHVAALIADAYNKGHRGFDTARAYEGMRKNAMEATRLPWRLGPMVSLDRVYLEKGFFPALAKGESETVPEVNSFEKRQAVSATLEAAYDDWCVSEMARALGKNEDHEHFRKRARNYANVYDPRIGHMAPKSADGNFVEGFDPRTSGGLGGREYFAEMNSSVYSFHVQHDIPGLMELMGGRDAFAARLDQLFTDQYPGSKYSFLAQFPDMTGLMGLYAHGDEGGFHIPYLYNRAGEPWKTQRTVREIMKVFYSDGPAGYCGDEDGGDMSSWYVFSAMGFYPVCPGRPTYDLGSPLFSEIRLSLGGGAVFSIVAQGVSAKNKYIQSAELNGQPLNGVWIRHADILAGGKLILKMGPRPNYTLK
jgi:predicted alpha-1,2-mannosidase